MRRFHLAVCAFALLLASQSLVAGTPTFFVGTCRLTPFLTISAAVSSVPAGSIVNVCAGTYSEQVVIDRALTLQGIFDNNSTQVVITVPSVLKTTSSINLGTIAAQVQVTAGPVTISNITVDGSASSSNCPSVSYVGILYSSGSSGKVNEVETRNQSCNSNGLGIVAENTAGAAQTVTIENSNVHDFSQYGIEACSDQSPATLTANIKSNFVNNDLPTNNFLLAIYYNCNVAGTISGNTIAGGGHEGIFGASPFGLVSGNIVTDAVIGISLGGGTASGNIVTDTATATGTGILLGGGTASGNTIVNAGTGISIFGSGPATASSNRILNSSNDGIVLNGSGYTVNKNVIVGGFNGIEFGCNSGNTVGGNILDGVFQGAVDVPATDNGVNTFYNVPNVMFRCP